MEEHRATRVPNVFEPGAQTTPRIDKEKFLVPFELTMAQLAFVVRRRLEMNSSTGLFLSVQNTLPTTSMCVKEVYDRYVDEDGFLYVTYSTENTFGGE